MQKDTTAQNLTDALRDQFCHTAVPDMLWPDGGPQFTSQIRRVPCNMGHLSHHVTTLK